MYKLYVVVLNIIKKKGFCEPCKSVNDEIIKTSGGRSHMTTTFGVSCMSIHRDESNKYSHDCRIAYV